MKFIHSQLLLVFVFLCNIRQIRSECSVEPGINDDKLKLIEPLFGQTRTVTDGENYEYEFSFCKSLDDTSAGVTQTKDDTKRVLGRVNATSIKNGTDWIFLTYKDGDKYGSHCSSEKRQSHLIILCNPGTLLGEVQILEENREKNSDCYYLFEVQSSVACVNKSSFSFGWVLIILILSIATVYLVVGFLYQRYVAHAKGTEQIPHLAYWQKLGGLSADGCDFICRCQKTEEVRSYKGLGDDQLGMDEDEDRDENILPM